MSTDSTNSLRSHRIVKLQNHKIRETFGLEKTLKSQTIEIKTQYKTHYFYEELVFNRLSIQEKKKKAILGTEPSSG